MNDAKSDPRRLTASSLALVRMAAHWRYVIAGVLTSAAIVVFSQIAPLTFDEARDRVFYGNLTIPQIIYGSTWTAANHIPVTALVHLIPQRLVTWDPWIIRIFGVASGILIVVALLFVSAKRKLTPLITVFAIAGSPLLASYLFIVRGYTFSAVFLAGAAAVSVAGGSERRLERVCLGGVFLAIGTWPLPTNALFAPGWVAAVLALWGYRVATAGAAIYATCVALMYEPIFCNIHQEATGLAGGEAHWWTWAYDTFATTNLVPVCFGLVAVAAVASVARGRRNIRAKGPRANFAILTTVMSGGWFLVIGPIYAAQAFRERLAAGADEADLPRRDACHQHVRGASAVTTAPAAIMA